MYAHGKKVNSGEVDDPGFLMRWYEGHADIQPTTRKEWTEEIEYSNPAAGDFLDTQSVVSRCMEVPRHEADRYHRNIWTTNNESWEAAELWDGLRDPSVELDKTAPLYVGIDVGVTHDASAVVWTTHTGGRLPVRSKIWENPNPVNTRKHDEWRFQIKEVEDLCRQLRDQFPESAMKDERGRHLPGPAFLFDPNKFERSAQDLKAEGLNMVEYPQADSRMIAASQTLFELIKQGVIAHNGDPDLRRHIRNVVAEIKPRGWKISKVSPHSPKHIDAAIGMALAVHQASHGEPAPPTPGVYGFDLDDLDLSEDQVPGPDDQPD